MRSSKVPAGVPVSDVFRAVKDPKTAVVMFLLLSLPLINAVVAENEDPAEDHPLVPLSPGFDHLQLSPHLAFAPQVGTTLSLSAELSRAPQLTPLIAVDRASIPLALDRDDPVALQHVLNHAPSFIHTLIGPQQVHPWLYAAARGSLECIRFMYENRDKYGIDVYMIGTQNIPKTDLYVKDGNALLHACTPGHLPVMKYFYDKGFFGTKADDKGASCVVNTISAKHHATSIPAMKSWEGFDLNKIMAEHIFKTLNTHLQLGPKILEGIRVMLEHAMDPNLSWEGQSLLDRAVSLGELELAENLRDHNATMTANANAVVSLVERTRVHAAALKKTITERCKDKAKECPYTEFHPETGLPTSQLSRHIARKMKVFSLLFEHNYDFKQCDETGETLLSQLANFLNTKLPNRHAHSSVTNNYDKIFYDNFVKKYLSPKLLAEIEKRAEQPEAIESETLTCHFNRVAYQNELMNNFFMVVGSLLFSATAFVFRRQIAQIPQLCARERRVDAVAEAKVEVPVVAVTSERSHPGVHADQKHSGTGSAHHRPKPIHYDEDRRHLENLVLLEAKMRELEDKRLAEEKAARDKDVAAKAAQALADAEKAEAARQAAQQKQRKLIAEQAAAIGAEQETRVVLSSIAHTEKAITARMIEMQRKEYLRQRAEHAASCASRRDPEHKQVTQLENDLAARAARAQLLDRQQRQRREQAERQVTEFFATLTVEKAKATFMERMQKAKFSLFDVSAVASRNADSKATTTSSMPVIAGSVPVRMDVFGVTAWNPPRLTGFNAKPIGKKSSASSANDSAAAPSQHAKKK